MGIFRRKIKAIQKPLQNKNILITGWPATGSTFIYQVINELVPGRVLKDHQYKLDNESNYKLKFFSIRDPRAIILSNAKRDSKNIYDTQGIFAACKVEVEKFLAAKYLDDYLLALNDSTYIIIKYEDFFLNGEEFLLRFIISQVGLSVSTNDFNNILNKFSIENNMLRSNQIKGFTNYDNESLIHGNHISTNGSIDAWKQELNQTSLDHIYNTKIGEFIKKQYE